MTQELKMRLNYHPDFRQSNPNGDRKVKSRLNLLTKNYNFSNKVVLDLGCSGGYFSFALSSLAKKVIGVDGDPEVIKRNNKIKKELGINNIEFVNVNIDSELINGIGKVDVTLLLSVYHHMITNSDAYDWNKNKQKKDNISFIQELSKNTNALFFDMGYPNEGYSWCSKLPYADNWDQWILDNVFNDYFEKVTVIGAAKQEDIKYHIFSKLSKSYKQDEVLLKRIKRLFRYDARDYRKIYMGVNSK